MPPRTSVAACVLLALALTGCGASRSQAPSAAPATSEVHFFGVVLVPIHQANATGKVFDGVLIQEDHGPAWVAAYRADALWRAFDKRRVEVRGTRYAPEYQALAAPHVRITTMSLETSDATAAYTRIADEASYDGRFEAWTWPEGTKLAGETWVRFSTGDGTRSFFLASDRPDASLLGAPVTVRGRLVEPSPYAARPTGEYLFVCEITRR